jgi:hypothetical protein
MTVRRAGGDARSSTSTEAVLPKPSLSPGAEDTHAACVKLAAFDLNLLVALVAFVVLVAFDAVL